MDVGNNSKSSGYQIITEKNTRIKSIARKFKENTEKINFRVSFLENSFKTFLLKDIQFTNCLPEKIAFRNTLKYKGLVNFLTNPMLINKSHKKSIKENFSTWSRFKKICVQYLSENTINGNEDAFWEIDLPYDINYSKNNRGDFRLFVMFSFINIGKDNEEYICSVVYFDPYHLTFPEKNNKKNNFRKRMGYSRNLNHHFNEYKPNLIIFDFVKKSTVNKSITIK